MERNISKFVRLMKMSWAIQKRKRVSRSKALIEAWAIISNEDITVFYLVQRYNVHNKPVKPQTLNQMALFTRQ
ncbi:MAG: hypothetical protein JNK00_13055 [Flavipsychrobacter sp.]|nr:hypothetical protein [Flavipsychrobacter sp.]